MFPEAKPRETLRSRGNKTHCFPRGQSSSVLLYLPTQNRTIRLAYRFAAVSKVHDLITYESKVQVVVALGRHEDLFALRRHEVLTNDT